jgi:hypothetical protein
MTDRSAVDTIRGYFYQFDLSILSVLHLANPDDSIEIECVEDIDVRTATDVTATQCKYYEKTEYNHSVIKEAVMYMLSHFKQVKVGTKPKVKYAIRGHYASGQDKLSSGIDVEFLKKHFLTYTAGKVKHFHHTELGLGDVDLQKFLSLLTVDINAVEFDVQFRDVIRQLEIAFACKPFSAEFFYYNNALAVIRNLSIKKNPTERSITKKAFLDEVNISSVLFNEWFVEKKGKKAHLAALRAEYFTEFNVSPFERFFLVEIDAGRYIRDELKELVFILSKKWSKLSKFEPAPFCPYLYIHGIPEGELLALKKELSAEGFKFVDGYDYQGADFNPNSIAQKANYSNGIKIKILNSLSNLIDTVSTITRTRRLFQFHVGQSYFDLVNPSVGHIKIQVEQLSDIKAII